MKTLHFEKQSTIINNIITLLLWHKPNVKRIEIYNKQQFQQLY